MFLTPRGEKKPGQNDHLQTGRFAGKRTMGGPERGMAAPQKNKKTARSYVKGVLKEIR